MTQEEKQLLFKDLCARLTHGVKVHINSSIEEQNQMTLYDVNLESETIGVKNEQWAFRAIPIVDREDNTKIVKPYLRPMSSMTDEELMEFGQLKYQDDENWEIVEMWVVKHDFLNIKRRNKHNEGSTWTFQISRTEPLRSWMGIDWLNAHHFDFRGLIEMGLALKAPEGMYEKYTEE